VCNNKYSRILVKAISNRLALSKAINKIIIVDKALLTTTLSMTTSVVAHFSQEGVLIQRPGKEPAQFQLSDIQQVWSGNVIFVNTRHKEAKF
jgi:hypothetical protein